MRRIDRRRVLGCLTGLGSASAVGDRLQEVAAAAPSDAVTMRISGFELYRLRVPWAERLREQAVLNWRRENIDNQIGRAHV